MTRKTVTCIGARPKPKEWIGDETARIMIDRFHVVEKYHNAADTLRKQEIKRLMAIFERHLSQKAAKIRIRAWIKRVKKSGLQCFDNFLKALEHFQRIYLDLEGYCLFA